MTTSKPSPSTRYPRAAYPSAAAADDEDSFLSRFSSTLSALNPLPTLGRKIFLSLLTKLRIGQLTITLTYDGNATFHFGQTAAQLDAAVANGDDACVTVYKDLHATLSVHSAAFWSRLVTGGDMGFAEGYMAGEVDCDNMMAFLLLMVKNKPFLEDTSTPLAFAVETVDYLAHTRLANTIKNSLANISAHYDLSNDMFAAFLDPRMQYSCAIWDWKDKHDSLEKAQLRKITTVLNKAKLTPESKLLEIGSGWGGLAVEAVRQSGGCSVVTITLSVEQKLLAEERVRKAEASGYIPAGKVQVLLCDYRKLPDRFPDGHFDTIVSVEMIEAVGREFLDSYFDVIDRMLHPTRGVLVLQAITMPEPRAEQYARKCDFIQKYIFPGGFLPSVTQMTTSIHAASRGNLIIQHMENYAPHYARTLQVWRHKFVQSYPTVAKAAVSATPSVASAATARRAEIGTDEFYRKFLYYFDYCAAGFAARVIDVYQVVVSREGCERLLEGGFAGGEIGFELAEADK
ncbi:Mycolic acid cyclopropane synthetase-domain-containing protein [Catenaria anguillulae PL171]|uniref:Mycolic acid cyclopropane synthetase-domain-containing protein n=1 Tax=Catenaria anguillulae PL171 TaxID=765915 RepID=A0A1Y2HUK2_9FUNG|nr:Mycolic acid cyclopropane synthetase-domain-containing protein [Catenaria anguillulae PL171]